MPSPWQASHLTGKTFAPKSSKVVSSVIDICDICPSMNDADNLIGFPQELQITPRNRAWAARIFNSEVRLTERAKHTAGKCVMSSREKWRKGAMGVTI